MKVRAVRTASFMRHDAAAVELPAAGIVLVTGPNGEGKSTLAEAVAHAAWGKSLRGAPGWRTGEHGGVEVELDVGVIHRTCSPTGQKKLEWRIGERGAGEYPTTTKAQAALEELVGSFDVWARACVFSSAESGRFTLATDRERKSMLEELLQLDRFGRAYDAARVDRRAAEQAAGGHHHDAQLRAVEARELKRQAAQAAQAAVEQERLPPDTSELRDTEASVELARARQATLREELRAGRHALRSAEAALAALVTRQRAVAGLGPMCPECSQTVCREHADELLDELDEAVAVARDVAASSRAQLEHVERAHDTAVDAEHAAKIKIAALEQEVRAAEEAAQRSSLWEARAAELLRDAELADAQARDAELAAAEQEARAAELAAVCDVLGLRGARNAILSGALAQIEQDANGWLDELGMPDLRVRVSADDDRIEVEVQGAGGGHGYRASSGGERRRIDIAIMLALAGVAARGVSDGSTLFFDELFDALDAEGVEDVVRLLQRLAVTRCVVIISHSRELAARLPGARHLVAGGGGLTDIATDAGR